MSQPNQPDCSNAHGLAILNCGTGAALNAEGLSIGSLLAAIAGSFASFGIQLLLFMLLRLRLSRIYRPRSYLVPERERVRTQTDADTIVIRVAVPLYHITNMLTSCQVTPPPNGVVAWLRPLFETSNLTFIRKCGLDAYFFLRYLRMLLKFFFPVALVILPILLPLNRYSGNGSEGGLDLLSISNVAPLYKRNRLWAHLILAIGVVIWFCYIIYKELRGYIRVRQSYLTSPQHRIRASATTVLVTGIPRKWLTLEALGGLYDVFPGGIKNIWINRNFDELSDKVDYRNKIAKALEGAETNLIKLCRKKHLEAEKAKAKKAGRGKKSKSEVKRDDAAEQAAAEQLAQSGGLSAGDQHQTPHGIDDVLTEAEQHEGHYNEKQRATNPLGFVTSGLGALGKGVGALGQKVVGDVEGGMMKVGQGLNTEINDANAGTGFATDDELYRQSVISHGDVPPTPPPKTPAFEREARMRRVDSTGNAFQTPTDEEPMKPRPHPLTITQDSRNDAQIDGTPMSEKTVSPDVHVTRPSVESRVPKSPFEIEDPPVSIVDVTSHIGRARSIESLQC